MRVAASPEGAYGAAVPLAGVAGLASAYDGFIVDQWGVLHDGTRAYAGAIECLERLRAAGKRVVILSNTGRGEEEVAAIMAGMGIEPRLYERCITAGQDLREALARRSHPFHARLGRRCYAFTRAGDASLLEGLGLELVSEVGAADFLAVLGIDSPGRTLADYEPELAAAAARRLPMLCGNPDVTRPSPQGLLDAAGVLARRYEALGGDVFHHGKPHAAIYASCVEALAGCGRDRIVAVGDSIEHDVLGATGFGLRCAFVTGGIHAPALQAPWGEMPSPTAWRSFIEHAPARPDYLLAAFTW
jgi:HAD superfamily hydrolase (TIGR01459 family)